MKNFFKIFCSFFPKQGNLRKLGYLARTFNTDFILTKEFDAFNIHIHQSVEPFNTRFGHLIDFEIEDACIIIEFKEEMNRKKVDQLRELVDFCYERDKYLFCMNKEMDFHDPCIYEIVQAAEKILKNT